MAKITFDQTQAEYISHHTPVHENIDLILEDSDEQKVGNADLN